jgi:hypothetical protein
MFERERCQATGKVIYATRALAKSEVGRLRAETKANSRKVYRCVHCDHYHASSGARGNGGKAR